MKSQIPGVVCISLLMVFNAALATANTAAQADALAYHLNKTYQIELNDAYEFFSERLSPSFGDEIGIVVICIPHLLAIAVLLLASRNPSKKLNDSIDSSPNATD